MEGFIAVWQTHAEPLIDAGLARLDAVPPVPALAVATAVVAVLLLGLLVRGRRRGIGDGDLGDLQALTAGSRRLAFVVIVSFFGVGGAWAALAPLDSAAIADGVVNPEGSRRSIQHLEGGIIRALHVHDGDVVTRGDPLVTLEDVQARARYAILAERVLHLRVRAARLATEQRMDADFSIPSATLDRFPPERVAEVVASERALFDSRRATKAAQEKVLDQRILQLEEENAGLREAIAGQDQQLELIAEEIAGVRQLYEQGLERLPRLLALQREEAQVHIDRAQNRARIASNTQKVGEVELEIARVQETWRERASDDLAGLRAELAEVESRFPEAEDMLARTVVRAPIDGIVVELGFSTVGGVIRPGERILDIVPAEVELLIDARVQPSDVDDVMAGQSATVALSAYVQRHMPVIDGRVRSVSADRLVDERTGAPYYLAKVEVSAEQLDALGDDVELVPGMPAQVMIATGARTFLDYLVTPVVRSFDRAFREAEM